MGPPGAPPIGPIDGYAGTSVLTGPGIFSRLLGRSVELIEQWVSVLDDVRVVDRLNFVTLTGTATSDRIQFDDLAAFTIAGNRIEAVLTEGDWQAVMRSGAPGVFAIDVEGPFEDAFSDEEAIEEAGRAATNDPNQFWCLCQGKDMSITASIVHDAQAAGFQWIRSADALLRWARVTRWPDLAHLLLPETGPPSLLIHDGGRSTILCGSLYVHGPDIEPQAPLKRGEADATAYAHGNCSVG